MLSTLIIAIVAASAVWVYLDATKHRIGKNQGQGGFINISAGGWGVVTLLLWIIAFPAYLIARKGLIAKAQANPADVSGRIIKAVILAMAGGFWFLASLANTITQISGTSGTAKNPGLIDRLDSAISSSEWTLNRQNSAIDGETLTVIREYSFASQNTQFDVEITCQPGKKYTLGEMAADMAAGSLGSPLSMRIKSFVGNVSQPSDASALVAETNFVRQNDYTNPTELNYPVARVKIGDNIYSGPMVNMVLRIGDYSNEAIYTGLLTLGESIPMSVELKNGAGTFELVIDRSSEVEQVLAACGQDEATLARAKAEQARIAQEAKDDAERKALLADRDNVVAAIGQSCRSVGDLSKFDMSEHEARINRLTPDLKDSFTLDCNESAPEQLKAFHDEFENEYALHAAYLSSGGNSRAMPPCSAKDFIAYIHARNGIENSGRSNSDDCEEWKRSGSMEGLSVEVLADAAADGGGSVSDYQADYERTRDDAIKAARDAISSSSASPKPED